jgi:DNA polymerase-3 subunit delta'
MIDHQAHSAASLNDCSASDLPWQHSLWNSLKQRLQDDRLPHALLIHGAPGVGKRALAQRLVQTLLCLEPKDGEACGLCRACRLSHSGGAHPDWVQVAPEPEKTVILVDQIRDLCAHLSLSAAFGGRRVGVIESADGMNVNAANALLKTLEEPGADVHIVLIADRPGRLPATIRSRCQPQFCPVPGHAEAILWLQQQHGGEAKLLSQAVNLAGGGPLLALEWLQQEVVAEARQVAKDLVGLYREPQQDPMPIWTSWKEIPAPRLWRWVLLNLHHWCRALQAPGGGQLSPQQLHRLLNLSQQAQQSLRLAASPVRDDLQIWQWLLQWSQQGPQQD